LSASRKGREKTIHRSSAASRQPACEEPQTPELPLPPLSELPSSSDEPGGYVRRVCELTRDAALALQTVHDQKLVHRDVKPANLMLTPDGSRIVLMDFGLTKGESLALTASRNAGFLGTLRYAAPEQLASAKIQVGAPADIRGLGCVLWEMLTGTRLFGECRDEAALATKVLQSDVPRLRTIDPAFDRDLDAIVARATERRIEDRIHSAGQFAQYLQLYLDHKPLPIRPPTERELLIRWCRRNALTFSLLLSLAAALLSGTAISIWQAIRATRAEQAALAAARAEQDATLAEKEAKDASLAREAETKAALKFVEDKVFAAARPAGQEGGMGRDVTLAKAIESAVPYVTQSFASQPLIEARLRLTLGKSFYFLGQAKKAAEQEEAARSLYARYLGADDPQTLQAMHNLASSWAVLGRVDDALKLREETLALRRAKLGPDNPDTLASMNNLALSYGDAGRHADALKLREETLARFKAAEGPTHPDTLMAMNNLGNAYFALNRNDEALKLREEAFALYKSKLGPDHPDTLRAMGNLASSLSTAGRNDEALKLREEALALRRAKLGPDHPATLISMNALGDSYHALERHKDALKIREENLALRKAKLGPDHPDTLLSMANLADSYAALGRHTEALKLREETFALRKAKLGPAHPETLMSRLNVAQSLSELHREQQALPIVDECLRLAKGKDVDSSFVSQACDIQMRYFQKARDAAGCRQTTETLENLHFTDPDSVYCDACFHVVTAGVLRATNKSTAGQRSADEECDHAMVLLKQAIAAGFNSVAHMKKDPDLDPLRGRDDFKKLVAQLEGAKEQRPKPARP
jgi:non-specific serine/threonine protein kinase/serine/threonine-protein kinase